MATARPEAALLEILDPFLWIEVLDPVLTTDLDTGRTAYLIRAAGIAKPGRSNVTADALASQPDLNAAGRALREELHRQAEDAAEAVVKAGFALTGCPEVSISGRLRHDRKTGLDIPEDIRAHVTLWFRPPPEP